MTRMMVWLALAAVLLIDSARGQSVKACPIYQSEESVCVGTDGPSACAHHCQAKYFQEILSAHCEPGVNGDSICVSCGVATVFGDPHYVSFDGTRFSYHGDCVYLAVKTIDEKPGLIPFRIDMRNEKRVGAEIAYPSEIELQVWGLAVAVKGISERMNTPTVNGKPIDTPFAIRRSNTEFLTIEKDGEGTVIVRSSIGINIEIEYDRDVFVYLAKSPLYVNNTFGILGIMNGDRSDDMVGLDMKKRFRSEEEVNEFGNTFCNDKDKIFSSDKFREFMKEHTTRLEKCKRDKMPKIDALCKPLNNTINTSRCPSTDNDSGEAWEDCATDVCYSDGDEAEAAAACAVVNAYANVCETDLECVRH